MMGRYPEVQGDSHADSLQRLRRPDGPGVLDGQRHHGGAGHHAFDEYVGVLGVEEPPRPPSR